MRRYLCAQGQALDDISRERAAAEADRSAERARHAVRLSHHRALHDTVLATLTAIARGGLDHRTEQVRERCARDAEYVRRLVEADDPSEHGAGLDHALIAVAGEVERLGLRVRYQCGPLPGDLPPAVVEALAGAAREALNNVLAHAGTAEAWLTALGHRDTMGEPDTLVVRVVDRGRGFDPAAVRPGFGLHRSVADRLREVGGAATVSSLPRAGTCVELTWSRPQVRLSPAADNAAGRPPVPGSPGRVS
jgi:signal transduction histidine kinase